MSRVPHAVRKCKKTKVLKEVQVISREEYEDMELDTRLELICALIPIGLMEVYKELKKEVDRLAGERYKRKGERVLGSRHGAQRGTVKLGGQKVPVRVPRVRCAGKEIPLESYTRMHRGAEPSEKLLRRVSVWDIVSQLRGGCGGHTGSHWIVEFDDIAAVC